jgi:hypothetical protein
VLGKRHGGASQLLPKVVHETDKSNGRAAQAAPSCAGLALLLQLGDPGFQLRDLSRVSGQGKYRFRRHAGRDLERIPKSLRDRRFCTSAGPGRGFSAPEPCQNYQGFLDRPKIGVPEINFVVWFKLVITVA